MCTTENRLGISATTGVCMNIAYLFIYIIIPSALAYCFILILVFAFFICFPANDFY